MSQDDILAEPLATGETYAWISFHHPDRHPVEVSEALGRDPTDFIIPTEGSKFLAGSWWNEISPDDQNCWSLRSKDHVDSLSGVQHLDWILQCLAGREDQFARLLKVGWNASAGIFWLSDQYESGPLLTPSIMGRFAELNLSLLVDSYASQDRSPDGDENDA